MKNTRIFTFWYTLMAICADRWEIQTISNDDILQKYRSILDTILPKSLTGRTNAFSLSNVPYAYFTIKLKCFRNAAQQ